MLIRITPGRSLRWAPRWDCSDLAVLFDASSGDYWVLSPDGHAAIRWLECEGPQEREALLMHLSDVTVDGPALLADLARSGLLMGLADGVPLRLERAFDAAD